MVKKDLTKIMEACENMPCCYKEYLALGKKICADITFKEYIYFQYGFCPKYVDENSFNIIQSSMEEPSCSNYVSEEEEKESKREDAVEPFVGPTIMRLFGCSSRRYSKSGDMSIISESEVSSNFLEKQYPLTNHPSKENFMNLPEEETCSTSNGSIDEEKEEGPVGPNILDRKYEEEYEVQKLFSIMEKGHDSLIS